MGGYSKGLRQFERRLLPLVGYPQIYNSDGSRSTHKMADAEVDGRYIAYPTIQQMPEGHLIEMSHKDARRRALRTGNYREFSSQDEAGAYARGGYKKGTNIADRTGLRRR